MYLISLPSSLLPIDSLPKLLIPTGPLFSSSNLLFKIFKTYSRAVEKQSILFGPRIYLLVHRNLLECMWDLFKIVLESIKLQF
jgi:hypothetical protein